MLDIAAIYESHRAKLVSFLCQHASREQAEEAVDDAFLALASSSKETIRSIPSWLRRVALNKLASLQRFELAERRRPRSPHGDAEVVASRDMGPVEAAILADLRERLAAAVAELPPAYREVLLDFAAGLDAGEIAARRGRPSATIRVQLHRAVKLLRDRLATIVG